MSLDTEQKELTLVERVEAYNEAFAKYPDSKLHLEGRMISGTWMIGNDYRNKSTYYGAYPNGYLTRVMAMFPDVPAHDILHLFSGSLPAGGYVRFDCQGEAEVVGDAQKLSSYFHWPFKLILADPPYTAADAAKYGTPLPNRRLVIAECAKVAEPGSYLVWLDTQLPMYRKLEWKLVGLIGLVRSTNHRVRLISLFQRV